MSLDRPEDFRFAFVGWLAANEKRLAPFRSRRPGSIEESFAHDNGLHRLLGEAGWTRYGSG